MKINGSQPGEINYTPPYSTGLLRPPHAKRFGITVSLFMAFEDRVTDGQGTDGFVFGGRGPLTRDVLVEWFRMQPGRMNAADFQSTDNPRWTLPEELPASCTLPTSNP